MKVLFLLIISLCLGLQAQAQYLPPSINFPTGASPRAHQLKSDARQENSKPTSTPQSLSPTSTSRPSQEAAGPSLNSVNQAAASGNTNQLKIELEKHPGAIKRQDSEGYTPLHYASRDGQLDAIKELLSRGANPNTQGIRGETALYLAAGNGKVEAVRALLAGGADPNLATREKRTPLHAAAQKGELDTVKALITGSALVSPLDNRGRTAIDLAELYASGPLQSQIISELVKARSKE